MSDIIVKPLWTVPACSPFRFPTLNERMTNHIYRVLTSAFFLYFDMLTNKELAHVHVLFESGHLLIMSLHLMYLFICAMNASGSTRRIMISKYPLTLVYNRLNMSVNCECYTGIQVYMHGRDVLQDRSE